MCKNSMQPQTRHEGLWQGSFPLIPRRRLVWTVAAFNYSRPDSSWWKRSLRIYCVYWVCGRLHQHNKQTCQVTVVQVASVSPLLSIAVWATADKDILVTRVDVQAKIVIPEQSHVSMHHYQNCNPLAVLACLMGDVLSVLVWCLCAVAVAFSFSLDVTFLWKHHRPFVLFVLFLRFILCPFIPVRPVRPVCTFLFVPVRLIVRGLSLSASFFSTRCAQLRKRFSFQRLPLEIYIKHVITCAYNQPGLHRIQNRERAPQKPSKQYVCIYM